jgi:hypothetical protein
MAEGVRVLTSSPLTPEEKARLDELGLSPDVLEPVYIGPTFKKTDDGAWAIPSKTIGWQILGWCSTRLNALTGGGRWQFTPEQARFLLHWYAVDGEGRFVHRKAVMQRLKGAG